VEARNLAEFFGEVKRAQEKLGLPPERQVISCYEAGRDGFWLHRALEAAGVESLVVDSASILVDRRKRRAKTDSLDVKQLLEQLVRHDRGDDVWRVVRVPSVQDEDDRRLHRERERLVKEITAHRNRIQSLLVLHGLDDKPNAGFAERLEELQQWNGEPLPRRLMAELRREVERLELARSQRRALEREQAALVAGVLDDPTADRKLVQVASLKQLRGLGLKSAWVFVMEFFGWRRFRNRKEVGSAAGLTPTPYASGSSGWEQGIGKHGSARIRSLTIEMSWLWLRYQPQSKLARDFQERYGGGSRRQRRVGIVAMARKLLIALWHYVERGVVPEGAALKAT
jgi:transposase